MPPSQKKELSQTWIDRVKVESGREIRPDSIVRALALRVSHTGRKVWQLTYRMPGSRKKQVLDLGHYSKTHLGIAEARKRAQEILEGVRAGIDPKAKPEEKPDALTLKKLAEQYIERYAKAGGKVTWDRDLELLERNVLKEMGDRSAVEIRKRELIEHLEGIARMGANGKKGAPIAANRTLAVIKTMYRWANQVDLIEGYDPAREIKKIAPENRRDRVLTPDEIRTFWEACEGTDEDGKRIMSPVMSALFRLRLITAQRGGEIGLMRWQDLDLEGAWWNIPKEFTKPKRAHRVPLTAMAMEIIKAQPVSTMIVDGKPEKCPWVFPNPKTNKPIGSPHKAFERFLEVTKLEPFVPHDLRRTVATGMGELEVPDLHISWVLNHAEKGVTNQVYNRYRYDKEKRQALDAWAERLKETVGRS